METTINLDDAQEINIVAHQNQICSITFTLSEGDTWSINGVVKLGVNYDYTTLKEYTVGDGLTIDGQSITWRFNPDDWGNRSVVYDATLIRVANGQRDFYGRINVNKSFS